MSTQERNLMNITRADITNALVAEWEYLCHDDYDPDDDTPEEFRVYCDGLTYEELLEETSVTEEFTLEEFVECWA